MMKYYITENQITDINRLLNTIRLQKTSLPYQIDYHPEFPFLTTLEYVEKIEKENPFDPLLLQILPLVIENNDNIFESNDPLCENNLLENNNGILNKYNFRSLIISSPNCASNCRFCFRRNLDLNQNVVSSKDIEHTVENILEEKQSIEEIILSGGDPLLLSNKSFANLVNELGKIDSVKRIRIHTRLPIFDSKRIDDEFLHILKNIKKQLVITFHINHPNEIDYRFNKVVNKLLDLKVLLFNQSVLLKGVNDDFLILKKLYELLINLNIVPYYQHKLDEVKGISHFNVSEVKIKSIHKKLKENMPGYMIPKFVKEIPNNKYKLDI